MNVSSDLIATNGREIGGVLSLFSVPSAEDEAYCADRKGKIGRHGASFELLADNFGIGAHPDLYGLVCLLTFGPFTASTIELDRPVSSHFADQVAKHLRRRIGPVDGALKPRIAPAGGRDGLAFSGGVDSCAALFLMPKSTVPIFLRRFESARRGLYRPDAALASCEAVRASGYDVKIVGTSIELARSPTGFPVDWSNAAPAVLHADQLNLRSICFGMIAESAFTLGHIKFSELSSRSIYSSWAPVFAAAGVEIGLPTACLSEVTTSRIALDHAAAWRPQSCVRGDVGRPCMRCYKCFRKRLLEAKLTGAEVPASHFEMAVTQKQVALKLLETPIHHEIGLAYSLDHLRAEAHPVFEALQTKTTPLLEYGQRLGLAERYYRPGLSYVPSFLREAVENSIAAVTAPMSAEQERVVQEWDLSSVVLDRRYEDGQERLSRALAPQGRPPWSGPLMRGHPEAKPSKSQSS